VRICVGMGFARDAIFANLVRNIARFGVAKAIANSIIILSLVVARIATIAKTPNHPNLIAMRIARFMHARIASVM